MELESSPSPYAGGFTLEAEQRASLDIRERICKPTLHRLDRPGARQTERCREKAS